MTTPALWEHQKEAVEYALKARSCFIALDMGGGKSPIGLTVAGRVASLWKAEGVLVACQAIMKPSWRLYIETWLPGWTYQILDAGDAVEPGKQIYVFNWELIGGTVNRKRKRGVVVDLSENAKKIAEKSRTLLNALYKLNPQVVIADESTYIKGKTANRTRAIKKLASRARIRLALTGTPVYNSPIDYISQLEFLDQIDLFGGAWMFKKRYAVQHHHNGDIQTCQQVTCKSPLKWKHRSSCPGCPGWQICECGKNVWGYWDFSGANNLMELNAKLSASCYFRRTKEQVQKYLPEFRREVVPIAIDRKDYDAAVEDFIEWMRRVHGDDAAERAYRAEALVRMEVLKQIVAAEKVDAAAEWISNLLDSGEKVVVFTSHTEALSKLAVALQVRNPLLIYGEVSPRNREERLHLFQEDSNLIILNIKVGGMGIDLTSAAHVVFFELDWTSTAHEQAESRLHRHGQTRPVTAWYLLGENTVDETIFGVLERKRRMIAEAVDGKPGSGIPFDIKDEVAKEIYGDHHRARSYELQGTKADEGAVGHELQGASKARETPE